MYRIFAAATIATILLFPGRAPACDWDSDCPAASRCVKRFGQPEGVCQRGIAPIDTDERRSPRDPRKPGTVGQPCDFQSDCLRGLTCVAQGNPTQKVCSN